MVGRPALLLVTFASVLIAGCTYGPPDSVWLLGWHGRSSNLLGSEQPSEIDTPYELSYADSHVLEDNERVFALALLKANPGIALVLAFRRPQPPEVSWDASTNEGTLEAWLYREYQPDAPVVTFDRVDTFWSRTDKEQDQAAIALSGKASIAFAEGKIKSIEVDLRSRQPVPLHRDYFEYDGSPWRTDAWLVERRATPARMEATIKGKFVGYWEDLNKPPLP